MAGLIITVNGERHEVTAPAATSLLTVLRDELGLRGPRFGCGLGQCGACMALIGAEAVATCRLPVGEATGAQITTLEGLGTPDEPHPVQQALLAEQAAQCGYCSNGMLIAAAALIWRTPRPTDAQIRAALDDNLCRCGSHLRIIRAVKRAAALMWDSEEGDASDKGDA